MLHWKITGEEGDGRQGVVPQSVVGDGCDLKNRVKTAALRIPSLEKKCCCAVAVEEALWGSAIPLLVVGIAPTSS